MTEICVDCHGEEDITMRIEPEGVWEYVTSSKSVPAGINRLVNSGASSIYICRSCVTKRRRGEREG